MEDGTFIFEYLLRQKNCMDVIDNLIINYLIKNNNTINLAYVPEFVLLITSIIKTNYLLIIKQLKIKNINDNAIQLIMEHFYNYITSKIKTEFNSNELYKVYYACVNLAIMKIKYSSHSGMLCFRKHHS
jgi:hypothetical protein